MAASHRRALVASAGAVIAVLGIACASPAQRGADSTQSNRQGADDDTARLARLEREARALVRETGCESASSCRTAPVGSRACGGPRDYVVYCAATTDTATLLRTLEDLGRAEAGLNERSGAVSTCEMRLPPSVGLQGGRCAAVAQPRAGEPPPS